MNKRSSKLSFLLFFFLEPVPHHFPPRNRILRVEILPGVTFRCLESKHLSEMSPKRREEKDPCLVILQSLWAKSKGLEVERKVPEGLRLISTEMWSKSDHRIWNNRHLIFFMQIVVGLTWATESYFYQEHLRIKAFFWGGDFLCFSWSCWGFRWFCVGKNKNRYSRGSFGFRFGHIMVLNFSLSARTFFLSRI